MKKILTILFIKLLLLTMFSYSCSDRKSKKFVFDRKEKELFNQYKLHDIIYFQSNKEDIDTISIVKINKSSESKIRTSLQKYITIKCQHLPKDKWFKKYNDYQQLISVRKLFFDKAKIKDKISYRVVFKEFIYNGSQENFGKFHKKITINNQELQDCYEVEHSYPERIKDSMSIKKVYWTHKYGLTAYSNGNGETWLISLTVSQVPDKDKE